MNEELPSKPHLGIAVLWAILGATATMFHQVFNSNIASGFLFPAQVILYVAAAWEWWRWFAYWQNIYFEQRQKAKAITPASLLAEKLALLSDEKARIIEYEFHGKRMDNNSFVEGNTEIIDGKGRKYEIPNDWIISHFEAANGLQLPATRNYSGGTVGRQYAQVLADYLVFKGAAVRASGPYSVRLNSWLDAMKALEWE